MQANKGATSHFGQGLGNDAARRKSAKGSERPLLPENPLINGVLLARWSQSA
jgi:hypothetical protein